MNKKVLKQKLDDIKKVNQCAIDILKEKDTNLEDNDTKNMLYDNVGIIEMGIDMLLTQYYNGETNNVAKKDYIWQYILNKITFDELCKKLEKESE